MTLSLSAETVVCIIGLISILIVIIIWALYKLYSYFRSRHDSIISRPPAIADSSTVYDQPDVQIAKTSQEFDHKLISKVGAISGGKPEVNAIKNNNNKTVNLPSLKKAPSRNRFIDSTNPSGLSHDVILHELLSKSSTSVKSAKSWDLKAIRSNASRQSTGFVPSLTTVEPSNRGKKSSNFLDLLNRLNEMDEDDKDEIKEKSKPIRATDESKTFTVSSSGIETNPSDETASQTFIGKEIGPKSDPGIIQLNLIRLQDDQV